MTEIQLIPLKSSDTEQFITDSRKAFNHGALEQFGRRNDHFEEDGKIISCDTIFRAVGKCRIIRLSAELL